MRKVVFLFLGCLLAAPVHSQEVIVEGDAPKVPDLSRFLPKEGFEEDGRRTLSAFPKNLGRSFVGVFSKESLVPFLVGSGITATSSFMDGGAHSFMASQGDRLGKVGGTAGSFPVMASVTAGLFVAGRFTGPGAFRSATYDMTQAVLVGSVYTTAIKHAVSRTRPDGSDNLSFPSGHTSNAFAMATVANSHFGPKVGIPSFLAASLIGASRVQSNKHNLSDVIAGATLGYIVGRTVVRENGEPAGRKTQFQLVPSTDARGTGVGAGVNITW
jgi:membrane-associated phospholipid phosphatase